MGLPSIMEFGGVINGSFRRNMTVSTEDPEIFRKYIKSIKEKCSDESGRPVDVYHCVYATDNCRDYSKAKFWGPLYFDIDAGALNEKNYAAAKHDTLLLVSDLRNRYHIDAGKGEAALYFSGSKGFHVMIPTAIIRPVPSHDLNARYGCFVKAYAKILGITNIDQKIYDNRRLFRVVNTVNGKTGLYKVCITLDQLANFSLEEMREYASEPRDVLPMSSKENRYAREKLNADIDRLLNIQNQTKSNRKKTYIPAKKVPIKPCVKQLLRIPVLEGGRNNMLVALSSALYQSGYKSNEVAEIMLEWNSNNEPPLPESEVIKTATNAQKMLDQGKGYGCAAFKDMLINKTCCYTCEVNARYYRKG